MIAHLNALNESLFRERGRLQSARTEAERLARRVKVAQIEREISGERKFLGIHPSNPVFDGDDDALAAALEA